MCDKRDFQHCGVFIAALAAIHKGNSQRAAYRSLALVFGALPLFPARAVYYAGGSYKRKRQGISVCFFTFVRTRGENRKSFLTVFNIGKRGIGVRVAYRIGFNLPVSAFDNVKRNVGKKAVCGYVRRYMQTQAVIFRRICDSIIRPEHFFSGIECEFQFNRNFGIFIRTFSVFKIIPFGNGYYLFNFKHTAEAVFFGNRNPCGYAPEKASLAARSIAVGVANIPAVLNFHKVFRRSAAVFILKTYFAVIIRREYEKLIFY